MARRMRPLATTLLASLALCTAASALLAHPESARADGPYDGAWRSGAERIEVTIRSWGADCGPRPQSSSSPGGATVQVTQEGDHLVFRGGRTLRTDGCWSENRAVRRVSTSVQGGTWRTVCRTPPGDSKVETGTYTLRANGADALSFTDASEYDWALNDSRCTFGMTITRSYARTRAATTTPPPPPPPEEPAERACTPGAPARIAMRPERAQLAPGERLCVRARVVDANGCTVPNQPIAWELKRPAGRSGRLDDGCFQSTETSAEAEGEFRVEATSGALRGDATLTVRTQDLSRLLARRGAESGALTGSDATARSEGATGLEARANEAGGSLVLPLVGAGVALVLLLGGVALLLGGRNKKRKAQQTAASGDIGARASVGAPQPSQTPPAAAAAVRALAPGGPKLCPVCHLEIEGDTTFCPRDGTALVAAPRGGPATPSQALICPTCRRGFPPTARFCPHDSDELIPYAMFAARAKAATTAEAAKPQICPKCGERYGASTAFCGKDGSPLVTVN
jgi:hypothetical protein